MSDSGAPTVIIYIILTLIATVISAVNKKRKKATPVFPTDNEPYLEEEQDPLPWSPDKEVITQHGEVFDWKQDTELLEEFNLKQAQITTKDYRRPEIISNPSQTTEKQPLFQEEPEEPVDFDLKKAIIYTEILNRKEW